MPVETWKPHAVRQLRVLRDGVLTSDMNFEERQLSSGIILPSDNGKADGIRPRWGRVYAVGPEQHDVTVGQWICVSHGRWTRGLRIQDSEGEKTIRRIDPKDILLVSDDPPGVDDTISDAVAG